MDKAQLEQELAKAENNCRTLFDQLSTAEEQVRTITTELERSRGDYRTLKHLSDDWKDPTPAKSVEEVPVMGSFPPRRLPNGGDTTAEAKKVTKSKE